MATNARNRDWLVMGNKMAKLILNEEDCDIIQEALKNYRSGRNMKLLRKLAKQCNWFDDPGAFGWSE